MSTSTMVAGLLTFVQIRFRSRCYRCARARLLFRPTVYPPAYSKQQCSKVLVIGMSTAPRIYIYTKEPLGE